jgi:hypothetical protein
MEISLFNYNDYGGYEPEPVGQPFTKETHPEPEIAVGHKNYKVAHGVLNQSRNAKRDGFIGECPLCECETCKNRRYQDGSDDSTVSFQTPAKMNPAQAANMVRSHEQEHVRNEQIRAKEKGEKVVMQTVRIKTAACPECGVIYVSGGETITVTRKSDPDYYNDLFSVGTEDKIKEKGALINYAA